jgi:hypothetical protein
LKRFWNLDVWNGLTWPIWTFETQDMAKRRVIWFLTTKSLKSPWFPCVQVTCHISLETFDKGYNFASDLISIGGLHTKLWASKLVGILVVGISGLPLGSPETKWHLGAGPVARHRVYYKGEGGGFPQVRAMVNLVSPSLPVIHAHIHMLFPKHRCMRTHLLCVATFHVLWGVRKFHPFPHLKL